MASLAGEVEVPQAGARAAYDAIGGPGPTDRPRTTPRRPWPHLQERLRMQFRALP